jgi:hypothetical protein
MQTPPEDDGRRLDGPDEEAPLESALVPHTDAPDELTLYPADSDDADITTHWITAREGAFVSLREWR